MSHHRGRYNRPHTSNAPRCSRGRAGAAEESALSQAAGAAGVQADRRALAALGGAPRHRRVDLRAHRRDPDPGRRGQARVRPVAGARFLQTWTVLTTYNVVKTDHVCPLTLRAAASRGRSPNRPGADTRQASRSSCRPRTPSRSSTSTLRAPRAPGENAEEDQRRERDGRARSQPGLHRRLAARSVARVSTIAQAGMRLSSIQVWCRATLQITVIALHTANRVNSATPPRRSSGRRGAGFRSTARRRRRSARRAPGEAGQLGSSRGSRLSTASAGGMLPWPRV